MSVPTELKGKHENCGGAVVFRPVTKKRELLAGKAVQLTAACQRCGASIVVEYRVGSAPVTVAAQPADDALFPAASDVRSHRREHGIAAERASESRPAVERAQAQVSARAEAPVSVGAGEDAGRIDIWGSAGSGQSGTMDRGGASTSFGDDSGTSNGGAPPRREPAGRPLGGRGSALRGSRPEPAPEPAAPAHPGLRPLGRPVPRGEAERSPSEDVAPAPVPAPAPAPARKPRVPSTPGEAAYMEHFAKRFAAARTAVDRVRDELPDVLTSESRWARPTFAVREPATQPPADPAPVAYAQPSPVAMPEPAAQPDVQPVAMAPQPVAMAEPQPVMVEAPAEPQHAPISMQPAPLALPEMLPPAQPTPVTAVDAAAPAEVQPGVPEAPQYVAPAAHPQASYHGESPVVEAVPQVAQPPVMQPQMAQPQMAQPEAQPQVAQPQMVQPQMAQPQEAQPPAAAEVWYQQAAPAVDPSMQHQAPVDSLAATFDQVMVDAAGSMPPSMMADVAHAPQPQAPVQQAVQHPSSPADPAMQFAPPPADAPPAFPPQQMAQPQTQPQQHAPDPTMMAAGMPAMPAHLEMQAAAPMEAAQDADEGRGFNWGRRTPVDPDDPMRVPIGESGESPVPKRRTTQILIIILILVGVGATAYYATNAIMGSPEEVAPTPAPKSNVTPTATPPAVPQTGAGGAAKKTGKKAAAPGATTGANTAGTNGAGSASKQGATNSTSANSKKTLNDGSKLADMANDAGTQTDDPFAPAS